MYTAPLAAPTGTEPAATRRLSRVVQTPPAAPGFIGEGHTAVEVLPPHEVEKHDPFVLLMDDRLDLARRRQIGGPHPHAGLETVTLVLEGKVWDRHEGELARGEVAWMTAGRGIVHNEHVEAEGEVRILQLWVGLPSAEREAAPALQVLRAADVPVRSEPGVVARVYSGASGGLRAPTTNLVPVTLVEFSLAPDARVEQELPASYRGFLYVVDGSVTVGGETLQDGGVGWFERAQDGADALSISAGSAGARVVLYAGEPHGEPIVQRGPFVAGTPEGLARFYWRYQEGRFTPLSEVVKAQRMREPASA
jgi:redox-sensitive bicupin YhaK (pirin superfamily)